MRRSNERFPARRRIDKLFNIIVSGSLMFNAIDKVFYILDQFTNEKPQWGVRELSLKIGLTPNLTHWYLKNLERNHVVRKASQTDKYELGYRIFELGNRNSKHRLLKTVAQPALAELSRATRGTAVLRVLEGGELICVASAESSYSLRVNYSEGAREACNFGCIGKLLMAHLDASDVGAFGSERPNAQVHAKDGHGSDYAQEGMGEGFALRDGFTAAVRRSRESKR